MTELLIQRESFPLAGSTRKEISRGLTDAFSEDEAMITMMGRARWQRISRRFFETQLHHSDTFLTARRADRIIGVLVARSPECKVSLHQVLISPILIRLLLGRHHAKGHALGQEISAMLPATKLWYINQLGIVQRHQGEGIGAMLLSELRTLAPEATLWVDCESALEHFYTGQSYRVFGRCGEDSLLVMNSEPSGLLNLNSEL
ncbi:MAG: GNAT superfamily N-acetyltransferase [Candidatus Azotimanducaceae bacterium]|jgi:GNAT superfamily N-acetyltransferase